MNKSNKKNKVKTNNNQTQTNLESKNNLITQLENKIEQENQITQTKITVKNVEFSIFYIESMIDKKTLSSSVLAPINHIKDNLSGSLDEIFSEILSSISITNATTTNDINQIETNLFSGFAVILFPNNAICCPVYGVSKRSIQEPPSAKVLKGPREGFVEDVNTNVGLVRKRIKSFDLKIKNHFVGERSKTQITIMYMENIAKDSIVKEVEKIIKSICIDAIIDSYYISTYLEGRKIKIFKRVGNTEKPDIFCAKLLEGRVGILVDGSPLALTVPFILIEDLQSSGDYYSTPAIASFSRVLRFLGLLISIIMPAVYVSLQSYNYRILPINFLITLLSSIEGLSIPPLLEILLVLFLFEIISEASVLMPNALGMALSIIGALALGNTAVDAGIISPPSIVIVAISSVAIHIVPDQFDATRLLRIVFTLIGGIIGLYGVFIGIIFLLTYLCSIESFGVPYLVPYSPIITKDKKDGFIMKPIQDMKFRPISIAGNNKVRQGKKK